MLVSLAYYLANANNEPTGGTRPARFALDIMARPRDTGRLIPFVAVNGGEAEGALALGSRRFPFFIRDSSSSKAVDDLPAIPDESG